MRDCKLPSDNRSVCGRNWPRENAAADAGCESRQSLTFGPTSCCGNLSLLSRYSARLPLVGYL